MSPAALLQRLPPGAREEFVAGLRAIAPQLVGLVPFGLVTGVASVASGLTPTEAIVLSFTVFSGVAQLVFAQLHAVGAPWAVILLVVAVVSLRLIMYSAAIAPYFAHLPARWRWLLASHLTDQSFALGTLRYAGLPREQPYHWHYLGIAVASFVPWQISLGVGAVLGGRIPAEWSLDFAVTLSFIVLMRPAIRRRSDYAAALVAAVVVMLAAGLPYRLALVAATLAGIAAAMGVERLWANDEAAMVPASPAAPNAPTSAAAAASRTSLTSPTLPAANPGRGAGDARTDPAPAPAGTSNGSDGHA